MLFYLLIDSFPSVFSTKSHIYADLPSFSFIFQRCYSHYPFFYFIFSPSTTFFSHFSTFLFSSFLRIYPLSFRIFLIFPFSLLHLLSSPSPPSSFYFRPHLKYFRPCLFFFFYPFHSSFNLTSLSLPSIRFLHANYSSFSSLYKFVHPESPPSSSLSSSFIPHPLASSPSFLTLFPRLTHRLPP